MTSNLTLGDATRLVEAAEQRANGLNTPMTIAIVDDGGHLVALHRMDGAKWLGPKIASGKAFSAAAFRAPSGDLATRFKDVPMFVTAITGMTHGDFTPQAGGFPISREGVVIGAIGVSGGSAEQDNEVATGALVDAGFA